MGSEPAAMALLLGHADPDLLAAFFAALPPRAAACLSRVCRAWAAAAELCLRDACASHGWAQPRRARLQQRGVLAQLPWRSLFVARACRSCMTRAGDFAVRADRSSAPLCFLCAVCAKQPTAVQRMQRLGVTLDVSGLSGKPLYTKSQSKFSAEVAKLSKEAIDNASGARADILRHTGRGGRRR